METIPFMIPSTSAVSEPSLKLASHTEMIFCRSSSSLASLLGDVGSEGLEVSPELFRLFLQTDIYKDWD